MAPKKKKLVPLMLRLPQELHKRLVASKAGRSLNQEIVWRLEQSFLSQELQQEGTPMSWADVTTALGAKVITHDELKRMVQDEVRVTLLSDYKSGAIGAKGGRS